MTSKFELSLVKAFNQFFKDSGIPGIAYRFRQHRYASQFVDVLVDSPQGYLGIEAKRSRSGSIYFSQFGRSSRGGQLERIQEFLEASGRRGYLAVEIPGRASQAWLLNWEKVFRIYLDGAPGLNLFQFPQLGYKLPRSKGNYSISSRLWRKLIGQSG